MNINLENLDLIPELLKKLDSLESQIKEIKSEIKKDLDLTKRSGVRKYLNISDSTISVMIKDGRLKQNIHFIKDINGKKTKITFIESAIKELKVS